MAEELKSRRGTARSESDGIIATQGKAIESAVEQEERRQQAKMEKRMELENSLSYSACKGIKTVMDDYFLDPLLGLIPGGVGDVISAPLVLPYIYVALFKVHSIPLTLSVIYNWLIDTAIGLIPFLGNIIDFFYRGNRKSYQQIVGFVEDDRHIISEVNGNAIKVTILIAILCVIIYYIIKFVQAAWHWIVGIFA